MMTSRSIVAFSIAVLVSTLPGCTVNGRRMPFTTAIQGSGTITTETRDVADFTGLLLKCSADVDVVIGPSTPLAITTDDNLHELVTTEVVDKVLQVEVRKSCATRHGIQIRASIPDLNNVVILGSGDVTAGDINNEGLAITVAGSGNATIKGRTGQLRAKIQGSGDIRIDALANDRAQVDLQGSGDISMLGGTGPMDITVLGSGSAVARNLTNSDLTVSIRGSGSVTLDGTVQRLQAEIMGSGDLHARSLTARTTTAAILASGSIETKTADKLTATIRGSGDVIYHGDPSVTKTINGSGRVRKGS